MLLFLWLLIHPFHIGVCEILYNEENKSLEISQKLFIDDLETAYRKHSGDGDFIIDEDIDQRREITLSYLKENFILKIDGKVAPYTYLGAEIEADALWLYIEVENVQEFNEIDLTYKPLTEVFDDQQNLVHFKIAGDKKSFILSKEKTQATYKK